MATITSLSFAIKSSWDGTALTRARDDLASLRAQMRTISGASLHFEVDADTEEAKAKIEALRAQARDIEMGIDLHDGELASAEAKLDILSRDREIDLHLNDHDAANKIDRISDSMQNAEVHATSFGNSSHRAGYMGKIAMVAFGAALVVLPGLINLVGASLTGVMGAGIVAVGILALKENEKFKQSYTHLWEDLQVIGKDAAKPMLQPLLDALGDVHRRLWQLKPAINDLFAAAAPAIRPLTNGLLDLIQNMLPGLTEALAKSDGLVQGFVRGLQKLGTHWSNMFSAMADGAEGLGRTFEVTFDQIGLMMELFGVAAGKMANTGTEMWRGFLQGFNNFLSGLLDGMAAMLESGNAQAFARFWEQLGNGVGGMLREALPGIGNLGAAVSNVLGPAFERIGPSVGTLVSKLADGMVPVVEKLGPFIDAFVVGLTSLTDWTSRWGGVLPGVTIAVWALTTALKANPVVAVITGIIMLVGWLVQLQEKTQWVQKLWAAMPDWLTDPFVKGADGTSQFSRGLDTAKEKAGELWDRVRLMGNDLKDVFVKGEDGTSQFSRAVGNVKNAFIEVKDKVVEWYNKLDTLFGFKEKLVDMWNSVKSGFLDAWEDIKTSLSGLGDTLGPLWQELKPAVGAILAILGAIGNGMWEAFNGAIKPVFTFIGDIISEIIQFIKGVVEAITGIIRTIKGLIEFLYGVIRVIAAFFSGNQEAFDNAWKTISKGMSDMVHGIGGIFKGLWTIITSIWDTIVSIFKRGGELVWNVVYGFVKGVIDFFVHLWDVLVGHSIVPDTINAIVDWFFSLPGKLWGMLTSFVQGVVGFFVDMANQVLDWVGNWMQWLHDRINDGLNIVRGVWDSVWNGIKDLALWIWNWIRDRWNEFWAGIQERIDFWKRVLQEAWDILWNGIKDVAQGIWNWIRDRWDDFWRGIRVIYDTVSSIIRDSWQNFWNTVRDVAQGIWDTIRQKWDDFATGLQSVFQTMVDKAGEIWDKIRGIFAKPIDFVINVWNDHVAGKFGLPHLDPIGGYATGGAVRGPGTGTSDDIPARLSNGEHVWTAKEVDAAGGHGAVANMRRNVLGGVQMYASGGPVEWMIGQQQAVAPELQVTSSYRSSGDYHGQGKAVDFSNGGDAGTPEMKAFARWIADTWGRNTLELIHSPFNDNIKDGSNVGDGMGFYGAGTMSEHRNHVHWAVDRPLDGSEGGTSILGKIVGAVRNGAAAIFEKLTNPLINAIPDPFLGGVGSPFGEFPKSAAKKVRDAFLDKVRGEESKFGGGPIGGSIPEGDRLAIINEALRITGTPPPGTLEEWQRGMNTLISRESGWNAGAVNNWDINAQNGNASRGLAQVIPTTFEANKAPGYNNIDAPVDNVAASINYIKSRYGNISNVQQANANMPPQGYARGTNSAPAGWALVGERGPEMVQFRGGETVKTFNEIIAALKDTTTGNVRELETKLAGEIKALVERVGAEVNQNGRQFADSVEAAIQRVLASAGMQLNLTMPVPQNAGDAAAYAQEVANQLLPQLEMLIRQRIGAR